MKRFILYVFFSLFSLTLAAQEVEGFEAISLESTMKDGDRIALLAVHFGTTHDDTRTATLDAMNRLLQDSFPEFAFREAWTSRMILYRLSRRGVHRDTPEEALLKMADEGFTHVVVQPSTLLDGAEMESLRLDVARVRHRFKEIRIGNPLLYSVEDCRNLASLLWDKYGRKVEGRDGAHLVFVGHGTHTPANALYCQMDHIFRTEFHRSVHVATIEGYPDFDALLKELKTGGARSLTLVPFLFTAGDHAKNDIDGEWRENLEREGYEVEVILEGLGSDPSVLALFAKHLRFALQYRPVDITEKKRGHALGKE